MTGVQTCALPISDSKGTDEYNMKLSGRRAQSVVNHMVKMGIEKKRLLAKGYGKTQPVADNVNSDGTDNPEGRALNRRIELKLIEP